MFNHNKPIGIISLLTIGLLFGISGVIAKYLSLWLSPYQVVEYRFLVAFLISVSILILSKQKFDVKKINVYELFLFAVTFPVSVIFFTLSIFNTTVSLAVFSFYISTLISSFIAGRFIFNEKFSKNKQIALFVVLIAVMFFTEPFNNFKIQTGFMYGLISGIFQTVASTYQKKLGQQTNRISLLTIQTITGVIVAIIALTLTSHNLFTPLSNFNYAIVFTFGAIFLAISYLFLVGFKYTNLNVGSILVSTELFFGPFFAYILLSEKLTTAEILGALCIATSIYYSNKD